MASLDSNEQPHPIPSSNAALDLCTSNERRAVEVSTFNGILLKSWEIFRLEGMTVLPLAVLLQVGTYILLPCLALYGNNWAFLLVCFLTPIGVLGLTLVRAMEMALAVYVTRKHYQGEGSPSSAQSQADEPETQLASIGRLWQLCGRQIWGTSIINSALLYGLLGFGTLLTIGRKFYTMFPWFRPAVPYHTRLEIALFILFSVSIVTLATSLGSTLILALPAAVIEGSTSVASNLRSVRLGKGQRRRIFSLFALSCLLSSPLVDYIFLVVTSNLWGSSSSALATVLAVLSMGPSTAYFQIVWVVAYLSARGEEDPAFEWPPTEEAFLV
eukprot:TRINITY_DN1392_c0_g1_i3.p1 TRINITY_DN1392_c0_g1~~TRINITY_DN1392_c0_g1_i3.p1  ORF type:complete len:328 (+),score=25.16 TRINITY_DN1392_c0_g1_i3:310-1293(+)